MKAKTHLLAAAVLAAAPAAAYAQNTPHILLAAAGGGFVGALLGALFACWLCQRRRGKDDGDSKKY